MAANCAAMARVVLDREALPAANGFVAKARWTAPCARVAAGSILHPKPAFAFIKPSRTERVRNSVDESESPLSQGMAAYQHAAFELTVKFNLTGFPEVSAVCLHFFIGSASKSPRSEMPILVDCQVEQTCQHND
mmetsp:Transcript_17937/g.45559  ORF Transcript_17937/g.45559 Transcript_17937/m.45559 type:complete len:134 (+) Transcript_17937:487-888(+)